MSLDWATPKDPIESNYEALTLLTTHPLGLANSFSLLILLLTDLESQITILFAHQGSGISVIGK